MFLMCVHRLPRSSLVTEVAGVVDATAGIVVCLQYVSSIVSGTGPFKFLEPVFIIACIVWNAFATMIHIAVLIAKWR